MMQSVGWMVIGLVAWSIWGHKDLDRKHVRTNSAEVASVRPSEDITTETADGTTDGLIASVERTFGVPGWYLYATWQLESGGNAGGQDGVGDHLASDLAQPGSACEQNRDREWCQKQWRALKAICKQVDRDGNQVCDSATVRTGYAFDTGPLQMLPTNIITVKESGNEWTGNAADYDHDGAVNPLSLPDAMAMAAKLSRKFHDNVSGGAGDTESWMKTVDRYRGGYSAQRRSKIQEHGVTWCETHSCDTESLVAAR